MAGAYSDSGVDTSESARAIDALVGVLRTIDLGRPSRSRLPSGHYAAVLEIAPNLGLALSTDGVGSKVIVAEQAGRYTTIGIDCIAMNVNDVVCVGAEPIAVLDYLAVERADPDILRDIGIGLKAGATTAGVEIPGGELAQLPELIRGHPSPHGFDLTGACVGLVGLDAMVTGERAAPGDVLLGLPSSGVHANGLTLARRALLGTYAIDDRPPELAGATVADALLEPTTIYVPAVLELLRSDIPVLGLAHITGDGLRNLLRLRARVGYEVADPLPVPPVFDLIARAGAVPPAEMHDVFNMGCGFVCVVPEQRAHEAAGLLGAHHPGTRAIGRVTDAPGRVTVPPLGLRYG